MDTYRKILMRAGNISLFVILILSAITGIVTYPMIAALGNGFDESRLITTLSVMLAGLCLSRLLMGWIEKNLTRSYGITLVLGFVSALLVLPLRSTLPFVLKGYGFPLLTGISAPRLLLSYGSSRNKACRSDFLLAAVSGGLLLLLAILAVYGALFASELARLLVCRITALPLLWFAPLFDFYAKRCGLAGRFASIALGILPLFPIAGILWETAFRLTPIGILLCLIGIRYDNRRSAKAQRYTITRMPS